MTIKTTDFKIEKREYQVKIEGDDISIIDTKEDREVGRGEFDREGQDIVWSDYQITDEDLGELHTYLLGFEFGDERDPDNETEDTDPDTEKEKRTKKQFSKETCKVDFTPAELKEFAEDMAQKMGTLIEKERAKKEVTSQFKAEIEALDGEIKSLASKVRNKFEYRTVQCEIVRDYEKKEISYIRTDTGEVHRERAMNAEELQVLLDLDG